MAPSQVWSELDVAEVLCGIFETDQEAAELSSSGKKQPPSFVGEGQQQQDTLRFDTGQGIRRRRLLEDRNVERERKCSRIQAQELTTRHEGEKEDGDEMDIGVGFSEGEGVKGKEGREGVLEKVKSILDRNTGKIEIGEMEEEEGGEWTEVPMGKGRGKKGLGKKGGM